MTPYIPSSNKSDLRHYTAIRMLYSALISYMKANIEKIPIRKVDPITFSPTVEPHFLFYFSSYHDEL